MGIALGMAALMAGTGGCIVGQDPGRGRCLHLREGITGAAYWLYLPEGYDESAGPGGEQVKRPLVMTFHGMKPFDNSSRQIREWQQEADRYGFVVCAPALNVADIFGPLPLSDKNNRSLQHDERAILAIMDELYRTVNVDPNRVLATCWSYGGYVAHYMANQHPERFSCIAVKQSNFNADLLDEANVPRYRDHKVAIYYTENDFAICQRESKEAANWYASRGFDLTYAVFEKKGHERTPGVAAEFFARSCGVEAKTPPVELAMMQVKEMPVPSVLPAGSAPAHPGADSDGGESRQVLPPLPGGPAQGLPSTGRNPSRSGGGAAGGSGSSPAGRAAASQPGAAMPFNGDATPVRKVTPISPPLENRVKVRLSSTIGVAPLLVNYSAALPSSLDGEPRFLWSVDGKAISDEQNGQKYFTEPGEYELSVLVTMADGTAFKASRKITVIRRVAGRPK